jgi:hypothetical protein
LAVASSVIGLLNGFDAVSIAVLIVAVVVPIGCIGYFRVSSSTLPVSKRATFLLIGASLIGFSIWAVTIFALEQAGFNEVIVNAVGGQLFIVTSLVVCLSLGAFAGELIGRNQKVQARLFNPADEKT